MGKPISHYIPPAIQRRLGDTRGYQIIASFDMHGNLTQAEIQRGRLTHGSKKFVNQRLVFDSVDIIRQNQKVKDLQEGISLLEEHLKERWPKPKEYHVHSPRPQKRKPKQAKAAEATDSQQEGVQHE